MRSIFILILLPFISSAQTHEGNQFRNGQLNKIITPFRLPLPSVSNVKYEDLDKDGDPDILKATLPNGTKVLWIDDDDDMLNNALEGDMDSDCLMVDLNGDGKYGNELDLIIDYIDENKDGKAEYQIIIDNGELDFSGKWESHYIWFMDNDNDGVFSYIDWDILSFEGWDHQGRANFFADYNGKSTMLKVHITTWDIKDLAYNWENPFLFFDEDQDGLTEMAIRLVDEPINIEKNNSKFTWDLSKKISLVQMTFDLDNDSRPENELDYDMSLKFMGEGFDYSDQTHKIEHQILDNTSYLFSDDRWRKLDELIYPDHDNAYDLTFERGKWNQCWFVFDEDDDCQRWERVEFYDPKDPFITGAKNGGLDHNPQADVAGDRGEWDLDFSGKGNLYISPLDCRLHLLGAEYGYWRLDQNAVYFQGWQGWRGPNLQPEDFDKVEPNRFGTMKYEDINKNGFIDQVSMDMDGDQIFESKYNLIDLGTEDVAPVFETKNMDYNDYTLMYKKMSEGMWDNAKNGVLVAEKLGLNTNWYSKYKSAKSLREKYDSGFWLSFYIFHDLMHLAENKKDDKLKINIQKAYFSTNWKLMLE